MNKNSLSRLNCSHVKKNQLYVFIVSLLLSIMTALRVFGIDRDYYNYQMFYEKISIGGYSSRFEPGFELAANIFKLLAGADSFILFLFFIAFVSLHLKLSILSNIRHYSLLVLIYFMLILPLHEMMQIRIALAVGIMYWALYRSTHSSIGLLKKVVLIGTGTLFHYSVIILSPFILFPRILSKHLKIWIVLISVTPIVLINYGIDIVAKFAPMVEYYIQQVKLSDNLDINPFSSRNLILLAVLLIGFFNIRHMAKESLPWFYVSVFGMILWYSFMWIPVFAHRFLEITIFSYLVWVPSLPKIWRLVSLALLFILASYFLIRALFISPFFS